MSAESSSRRAPRGGTVVRPHSASDSNTVMESLVHFLQDVVGGTESSTSGLVSGTSSKTDGDSILWARFDSSDINDVGVNPAFHGSRFARSGSVGATDVINDEALAPPLVLILGYANGAQVWSISASGEAAELLSLRNGPVKVLIVLSHPECDGGLVEDRFAAARPLVAICDSFPAAASSQPCHTVKFVSLLTGAEVHSISYKQTVSDIVANRRVIVVSFHEKFVVLDALTLKHRFWVGSCYPCSGPDANPIALSSRWLAYADTRLVSQHQSGGGVSSDGGQSYTATVINAARSLSKGLTVLGETVASSLSGGVSPTSGHLGQHRPSPKREQSGAVPAGPTPGGCWPDVLATDVPGIVSIIDVDCVEGDKFHVDPDAASVERLIAHFPAHVQEAVAALAWDSSGQLLFSADRLGHNFNIFKILPHPWNSSFAAVHHLYTLHRGDTTAKVQDVAFSLDSRWVAVSTYRGTTHVFPISPYGGPISVRTHLSTKVVNRASRFHKSAGIDEFDATNTSLGSPANDGSPNPILGGSPQMPSPLSPDHFAQSTLNNNHGCNPRLTCAPSTLVHSVAHVKQPLTLSNAIPGSGGTNPSASGKLLSSSLGHAHSHVGYDPPDSSVTSICVASVFGPSRGWLGQHPSLMRGDSNYVDALFVMGWHGGLLEYILEPFPAGHPLPSSPYLNSPGTTGSDSSCGTDFTKIAEDNGIEVTTSPRARWMLRRLPTSVELRPPLSGQNALLSAQETVASVLINQARNRTPTWRTEFESSRPDEFQELKGPEVMPLKRLGSGGSSDFLTDEEEAQEELDEGWLSQVEMVTYAGPHRRLWMGPQFSFKVVNPNTTTLSSSSSALFTDPDRAGRPSTFATLETESGSHGAAPMQATAGRFDSLLDDINLESLQLSGLPERSNPVEMPAGSKGGRRQRTSSGISNASDSRQHATGEGSFGTGIVEVYGSWPDSARPELEIGIGVGVETIGEEGATATPGGDDSLLKESLADAMLEAALGVAGTRAANTDVTASDATRKTSSGEGSSGEFVVASEEFVIEEVAQKREKTPVDVDRGGGNGSKKKSKKKKK